MAQFARPDGDFALNGWTQGGGGSSNIYLNIDEVTPVDSDFIEELTPPMPNFGAAYQTTLSNVTDPVSSSNHIIRWRGRKDNNSNPIDLQIELRQGTSLIAQFTQLDVSNVFTTFTHTLSAGQANSITDYNDLRFYIYASDPDESEATDAEVSWAEFEVPDAAALTTLQTVQVIWDVQKAIAQTCQKIWNIKKIALQTCQKIWNVKQLVVQTCQKVWNTRFAPNGVIQVIWNVAGMAQDTIQVVWDVKKLVSGATVQFIWNLQKVIVGTCQKIWNVRKAIVQTCQKVWNVKELVIQTCQKVWNVKQLALQTCQKIWNVRKAILQTCQKVWNVLVIVGVVQTVELIWNVQKAIVQTCQKVWNVQKAILQTCQKIWNTLFGTTTYYLSKITSDLTGGDDFNATLLKHPEAADEYSITVSNAATDTSYVFTVAGSPWNDDWETGFVEIKVERIE